MTGKCLQLSSYSRQLRIIVNNLHNYFSPCGPTTQSLQCPRYTLQTNEAFIIKGSSSELALSYEIKDALPDNRYLPFSKLAY
jgi:hypothetical protein